MTIIAGDKSDLLSSIRTFVEPEEEWLKAKSVLSSLSSPDIAIAHLKLFFPELINYRGGWFLGDAFDVQNADLWFDSCNGDVRAVESLLNHIHLQNYTFGCDPEQRKMTEDEAVSFGKLLAYQWKNWFKDIYNIEVEVYLERESDDNPDIQISFNSVKIIK